MRKPSADEIRQAVGKTVPDVIDKRLKVLFCGINPSLYSAAVGHHFARPGNRFWPVLHKAGFTERQLSPDEDRKLLLYGYGITNIVDRATARADELSADELLKGAVTLRKKLKRFRPKVLAVLGKGAFEIGFQQARVDWGPQKELLEETVVWVLPNPSGLNANFQIPELVRMYQMLV